MKRVNILFMLCAFLLTTNLSAQTGVSSPAEETPQVYNFDKLLEQYKELQALDNDLPPGWDFTTSDKVHIISVKTISNPNLCGVPIEAGDYIGVFYIDDNGEEACGGAGMWTGIENVPLVAYGDDSYTPGKDGFTGGEELIWYVYSYSLGEQIYPASPEFDPSYASNNKFYSGGLSIVEDMEYYYENDIVIPAGWSGMSSYTETSVFPPIIGNVMDPIDDELILIQDMQKMFYPGVGINTMFIWTDGKGYKVKLDEEAVLPMTGCPVTDKDVDLTNTWNIFPVLSKCNVLVTDIFASIMDKVIVIKEIAGNRIFWPEMGIQSLYVLEPGKAYYVAVSQNTSITYGDCQSMKSEPIPQPKAQTNLTPWNDPVATGFTHTIAFTTSALETLQPGDYIGAFNEEGLCVGLTKVEKPAENIALTVYGEDLSTDVTEGMDAGEKIQFGIYSTGTNETVDAAVEFDHNYSSADGLFADNGLSVVSALKLSSTGVQDLSGGDFEIYPNPATGIINVFTANEENLRIAIRNLSGQMVLEQAVSGNAGIDVSDLGRGVYFVEISGSELKTISKLILN